MKPKTLSQILDEYRKAIRYSENSISLYKYQREDNAKRRAIRAIKKILKEGKG